MSIDRHAGNPSAPTVRDADSMYRAVRRCGIIPFFENPIRGWSVEEMTPPEFWFSEEGAQLGPWDWKIDCLEGGDIAYGKFLCGGKAAFATVPLYRELMNVRRPVSQPDEEGQKIMTYLEKNNVITIKGVRDLLQVKKAAADAAIAKLQHQCRVVTGAIERVYRGPGQLYNGWQISYFCTPESLFGDTFSLQTDHTPEESLEFLVHHVERLLSGEVSRSRILKLLK